MFFFFNLVRDWTKATNDQIENEENAVIKGERKGDREGKGKGGAGKRRQEQNNRLWRIKWLECWKCSMIEMRAADSFIFIAIASGEKL